MLTISHAPKKAAMTAGTPKRMATDRSACLPTRASLNRLLKKWTTPVSAMARSTGKKTMNTGVRMVPKPNPEKKVSTATTKAANDRIRISIGYGLYEQGTSAHQHG